MAIGSIWVPIIPILNGRPPLYVVSNDEEEDD